MKLKSLFLSFIIALFFVSVVQAEEFTEEEVYKNEANIKFKNDMRERHIQDAIASGDWEEYYFFEQEESPAWYTFTEKGYVPNKFYYARLLESTAFSINFAEDEETKEIWTKELYSLIKKFNNAPTEDNIIPYVVHINHLKVLADEYGVPEPSKEYFDSKFNDPLVNLQGKFSK